MHIYVLAGLWAVVAYVPYFVVNKVVESRRHAGKLILDGIQRVSVNDSSSARAKELGCEDAVAVPDLGFLGLKGLKRMQKADKEKLFPDLMIERADEMSALTGRVCTTFKQHLLGQEVYFTSDPKNIQAMLATQFNDFGLGKARNGNMIQTLGDGIFVQDGKKWEHSRALLRPNFVRDQVSDLDLEERHVQNLLRVMPVQSDGWTAETDIQTLFFRLTIDSATEFLFGESVDSQITEAPGMDINYDSARVKNERAFSTNFDAAQMHMAQRFRLGDMYWTHNPKEYKENNKIVNQFISHYVDLGLRRASSSEKKAEEGHSKAKYVFLEALAEQTRDPVEIRAQLLNILLAGRDTTASLLSWLFHELLRNPEEFNKLRTTIIDTFGTYDNPREELTFVSLKGCQYLQYTLNEVNRLWSIVPGNARRSNKATTLPTGGGADGTKPIYIKPQTDIQYSIHVMHRRTDLWGEDAHEFKPERFRGRRPGWEYLPFNGGPRICIGQQFALTEASYVTVRLLQRFDQLEAGAGMLEGPVTSNLTLTNAPGKNVRLRMRGAKEE